MTAEKTLKDLVFENYNFHNDIKVFGFEVKNFPAGIGEAFDKLVNLLAPANEREYFGISICATQGFTYVAAAREIYAGEASKYGLEEYTIEKGAYVAIKVTDWRSKTHCINQVFEQIFRDNRTDKSKPCIEIYKDDHEMYCLVKADQRKMLQAEFNTVVDELVQAVSRFDPEQLNRVPFEGSWTAGQVAEHLYLSNTGFAQLLNGPAGDTERAPDEWVERIKADFMDFNQKAKSPEFVLPRQNYHYKEDLFNGLEEVKSLITTAIQTLDLDKTCLMFELPVCGYLTRLEALTFVIYHSKRHLHQLNEIFRVLSKVGELEKSI